MKNILYGKLRSNIRTVNSESLVEIGHFSITIREKDNPIEKVENIYLKGKNWDFAKKNLKKGTIAKVYFEYEIHEWFDLKTKEIKKDLCKFAVFIKPKSLIV
jgi:hypothetical protein